MSEPSPAAGSAPAPDIPHTPVPDATVEDVKPDDTATAPTAVTATATTTTTTTTTAITADLQADVNAEPVTDVSTTAASPTAAENYPIPLPSAEGQQQSSEPSQEVAQLQNPLEVHEDAAIHHITGEATAESKESVETMTTTTMEAAVTAVTATSTDAITAGADAPVVKDIHDDILALSEQDMEMANRSFNAANGGVGEGFSDSAPSLFHTDFDHIASGEEQQQQQGQQQQIHESDTAVGEDEPHNVHDPIPIPEPVSHTGEESQSHFSQMGVHTSITIEEGASNAETAPSTSAHNPSQAPQFSDLTLSPVHDITSTDFFSTGFDTELSSDLPAGSEPFSMAPSLPTAPAQTTATESMSTDSGQAALLPTSTQEPSLETATSNAPSSTSVTQPDSVAQTTVAPFSQYDNQYQSQPQPQPQSQSQPQPQPQPQQQEQQPQQQPQPQPQQQEQQPQPQPQQQPQPPPPPPPPPSEPARIPHPVEQLQHYQPSPVMAQQTTAAVPTTMTSIASALPPSLPTQTQTQPYQSTTPNYQYQPPSQPFNPNAASTVATLPPSTVPLPPIQSINNTQHQPPQAQQVQPQQTSVQLPQQQTGPSPSQVPLPLMGTIQMSVAPAPVQNPNQTMGHFYTGVPGTVATADSFQIGREPNRLLSGGRAKKEVKRRTKTGCLTCRKRRIKCDERHPVCRNCEKSKRECLGYDPVFRSQTATGNATLQPAPPSQSPSISGLSPIQSPQYATQHILIQQPPPPIQPIQPLQQQQQVAAQPVHQQFQQAQPVQLQQQPQAPTTTAVPQQLPSQQPAPPPPLPPPVQTFDYTHPDNIKALANAAAADPPKRPPANMLGVQELRMRHVNIHDLLSVRGHVSPLPPEIDVSLPRVEEIKMIYMSYANGIDKFLECHWFETKGLAYLLENKSLLSQYSALLDGFNDRNIHDPNVLAQVESREASVIWNTFTLCRSAHARTLADDANATTSNNDPELLYAVKRLSVIETMLTGGHLETNPVDLNSYPESDPTYRLPGLGGQIKIRELEFWQSIGRFLIFPGDDDPNDDTAQREKEAALLTCRGLLDTFENRDVIYSIAIARHIAKFQPGKIKTVPATADERDASSKLYVACRFLEDESRGKGTNQVIKRVAGMIVKYWEDPALMM